MAHELAINILNQHLQLCARQAAELRKAGGDERTLIDNERRAARMDKEVVELKVSIEELKQARRKEG